MSTRDPLSSDVCALQLRPQTAEPALPVLALKPGRNLIGRASEADIRLEHPSVSLHHCDLEVDAEGATVQDLGSTNGTFIDGEPVQRAVLRPGQILQVGSLPLVCESLGETGISQPGVELPAGCAQHPNSRAGWVCLECGKRLCAACIQAVQLESNRSVWVCTSCQGLCERLDTLGKKKDPHKFSQGLLDALVYPLRGSGWVMMLAAAGLNGVVELAGGWLVLRGLAWMIGVAVGSYALLFLRDVVLASTAGSPAPPEWPVFDRESLLEVTFQWMGTYFLTFGPWLVCRFWVFSESGPAPWVRQTLLGLALFYFPMAVLAVIKHDSVSAANPVLVTVSVFRALTRYLAVCTLAVALGGAVLLLEAAASKFSIPGLRYALTSALEFYAVVAVLHALGWMYYCSREQLQWE